VHQLESVEDQIEPEVELALACGAHRLRHVLIDVIVKVRLTCLVAAR
jgi:hypothetical protein